MALASGDILTYDGSEWVNQKTLVGPFSVDSPTFHVDSANDRVGIGTTSPSGKLHLIGSANVVQFLIHGNLTQTASLLELRNNGNSLLAAFDADGNFGLRTAASTAARIDVVHGSGATGLRLRTTSGGSQTPFVMWDDAFTPNSTTFRAVMRQEATAFRIGNLPSGGGFSPYITMLNGGDIGIGTTSPNSLLHVNGPIATAINETAVTSSPHAVSDAESVIRVDGGSAAITVELPSASGIAGRQYTIKKIDNSNNVTVTPDGSEEIDGAGSYVLTAQWQYVTIVSTGADWEVVANN